MATDHPKSKNGSDDPKPSGGVGRTPWDFATELLVLLGRIGPAAVIVAGILVAGYFFYSEINTARLEADAQLQKKLEAAQTQLVATYEKMSSMSGQLIGNIDKLMDLNSKIQTQVDDARSKLGNAGQKLETAEREAAQAEQARQILEQRNLEIKQRQAQTQATLATIELKKKQLDDEIRQLENKRVLAESALSQRTQQIDAQNKRIAELEQELAAAQGLKSGADQQTSQSSALEGVLRDFIANSESVDLSVFYPFVGMKAEDIEALVKPGLGYAYWAREYEIGTSSATDTDPSSSRKLVQIYGVTKTFDSGDGPYVVFDIDGDSGFVTNVRYRMGYRLVRFPRVEDWYSEWYGTLKISSDVIEDGNYFVPTEKRDRWTWNQVYGQTGFWADEPIFGDVPAFRAMSLQDLSKEFPSKFVEWSKANDAYGRPGLILRMSDRVAGFSARRLFDAGKFEIALGKDGQELYGSFADLADAVVKGDVEAAKARLDPNFSISDLGVLAAILLRDNSRIDSVNSVDAYSEESLATGQVEIVVSVDAIDPTEERQRVLLDFGRNAGESGWQLRTYSDRF